MSIYKFSIAFVFASFFVTAQQIPEPLLSHNPEKQQIWVDSVYQALTLNQKIGQLFMVQVFSDQDALTKQEILRQIKEYQIGGVIYSKGGPKRQVKLNNELQAISHIPLLVGMDAEWGLNMRLDSTFAFPYNMTLGAIKNDQLIYRVGQQIAAHCKRIGVHVNFAPVVDINTNPNNPIIGNRSFGEDKIKVTKKSIAFMNGLQNNGVFANAKHFPGHGDTETDSHLTLPTINFNEQRIDSVELFPYREMIKQGLSSVMVAHLNVPSLESRKGYPSSLSKLIVTDVLKNRLGFKGLIFTDALTMKGVSKFNNSGEIDLAAFEAGNDVLLMSANVAKGIEAISKAYVNGQITETRLAHSVKKILMAKYAVGLHDFQPISTENILKQLNSTDDKILYEELIENALTVVKNDNDNLPLRHLEKRSIAYVALGDDKGNTFLEALQRYGEVTQVMSDNLNDLIEQLKNYNTVIVGFHKSNDNPWKSYQFKNKELVWLYEIARTNNIILNVFAKPYALLDLKTVQNFESIVVSYQNSEIAQQKSAQLIFGGLSAKGHLPVSVGPNFKVASGIEFPSISRLQYGIPERVGMNSRDLKKIDSIVNYAIDNEMTPGVQLLVARKGMVIYHKTYGKHRYTNDQLVKETDLYDVASLTKILSTIPLLMELVENGTITLDTPLSSLLKTYKNTNKEQITIKEMLSHYAKLRPWIPFYMSTIDSVTKKPQDLYYRYERSEHFNIKVANNLFLKTDYRDTIQKTIIDSDLLERLRYRYSDLPYYILKEYIEDHYDEGLDLLVQEHFYKSLGANLTTYNPLKKFSQSQIIPSEIDDYFRHQEIHGYVHDMGAAMQNGVGGHAGVFSNANDVAKIMQLFLQQGYYGGKRYFKTETINAFNTCYFCEDNNRRGIGFDKPQLSDDGPTCGCVSMTSFGHSGFTGTYAWADPEEDLVYVFMANRTWPQAKSNKLLKENIRTDIQRLIYEAIEK